MKAQVQLSEVFIFVIPLEAHTDQSLLAVLLKASRATMYASQAS